MTNNPDHLKEYLALRAAAKTGALSREERQRLAALAIRAFTRTVRDERGEHNRAERGEWIDLSGSYYGKRSAAPQLDTARLRNATMSTEFPVVRRVGEFAFREILVHTPAACDLNYVCSGRAPGLVQHNHDRQFGVVESAGLLGRTLRGTFRFSAATREGQEMWVDVEDKIRRNVSLGYNIASAEYVVAQRADEMDELFVDGWEPIECSIVSVGADPHAMFLDD